MALIAIILYSVVPTYRYVKHGLAHVPAAPVMGGIQMGATPRQPVKAPLAWDSIRLGLTDHHGGAFHAGDRGAGGNTRSRPADLCGAWLGGCWHGFDWRRCIGIVADPFLDRGGVIASVAGSPLRALAKRGAGHAACNQLSA